MNDAPSPKKRIANAKQSFTNGSNNDDTNSKSSSIDSGAKANIAKLPQSLITNIFDFLPFLCMLHCQHVNKLWLKYCKDSFEKNIKQYAYSAAKLKHLDDVGTFVLDGMFFPTKVFTYIDINQHNSDKKKRIQNNKKTVLIMTAKPMMIFQKLHY